MTRPARVPALIVTVLALLLSVVPAASAWEPPGAPIFNNPKGNKAAKFRIVNAINKAVRNTPRGATLLMSAYLFDNGGTYKALVGAHKRGVHVQMVLDGAHARNGKTRRLAKKFNRDNVGGPRPARWGRDQSFVVFCKQACRGRGGFNHTKVYAFSRTGTATNVVMTSSSNPNAGGATKGWNDMYVLKRKPRIFDGVTRVIHQMSDDTPAGDKFQSFSEGGATAMFYPKHTGTHPVLTDLNKVHCAGGGTALHVSMFRWNRKWGKAIAKKLVGLANNGCTLNILYGAPSREIRLYLTKHARRSGRISLWDSRFDRNGDRKPDLRVHHKYLLIKGRFGTSSNARRITTGSQNWGASLRTSDENTVTVNSGAAYSAYLRNWQHIKSTSARRIG